MDKKPENDLLNEEIRQEEKGEDFSLMIKNAREEVGYSLNRVALATRISPPFIEALEKGEFEKLPGTVFGRGFIRSLCKVYDKDPNTYLEMYEAALDTGGGVAAIQVTREEYKPRNPTGSSFSKVKRYFPSHYFRMVPLYGAIAVSALTIYGAYHIQFLFDSDKASTTSVAVGENKKENAETLNVQKPVLDKIVKSDASSSVAIVSKVQESAEPKSSVSEEKNPKGVAQSKTEAKAVVPVVLGEQTIKLEVIAPVKVKFNIDAKAAEVVELEAKTHTYHFEDKAQILVYDASKVKISYNDKPLGFLGSEGRIRRLSFKKEDEESIKSRNSN